METRNYKGFTISLVESPNGSEKWYNVFENGVKQNNENRSLNTLSKAKYFINAIIEAEALFNKAK